MIVEDRYIPSTEAVKFIAMKIAEDVIDAEVE